MNLPSTTHIVSSNPIIRQPHFIVLPSQFLWNGMQLVCIVLLLLVVGANLCCCTRDDKIFLKKTIWTLHVMAACVMAVSLTSELVAAPGVVEMILIVKCAIIYLMDRNVDRWRNAHDFVSWWQTHIFWLLMLFNNWFLSFLLLLYVIFWWYLVLWFAIITFFQHCRSLR